MQLRELIERLGLELFNDQVNTERAVTGGYTSDLLSDVMGNAREGEVWITLQSHMNVAAIASLKDLPGVVLVKGTKPGSAMLQKATEEGIPVLGTPDSSFTISGKIYEILKQR